MKRNFILFLLLMLSVLFISSCARGFSPMYYYNKRSESLSGGDSSNNPPPTPPEEIPEDEDPFKVDNDYNKPDYGGYDASQFDKWLFKVSFRGDKLPIYVFFDDSSRAWSSGALDWRNKSADFYKANDGENKVYGTVVGDVSITSLKIYKYNKENPLYDSVGYLPGRMDRFRFYSIDGEASVSPLKQYLIAVDTYSKFVFAFGAITGTKNVAGDDVPIEFEAIEYHADKKHFYEYDPIGYVDKSGSVILYKHYEEEFVKAPTSYVPKNHGFPKMATHTKLGQGHSPYIPIVNDTETTPENQDKFKENVKEVVNKKYMYRNYGGWITSDEGDDKAQINLDAWKKAGYSGASLVLYSYILNDDATSLTVTTITNQYNSSGVVEVKEEKIYTREMITAEDKAIYKNGDKSIILALTQKDNQNTISIDGLIMDINFKDYGPLFVDRVKSSEFENTYNQTYSGAGTTFVPGWNIETFNKGEIKFIFNEDATQFTMKLKNREYNFELARFDNSPSEHYTAVYKCLNESSTLGFKHARVVLRENDKMIKISTVLGAIWGLGTGTSEAGLGYDSYRK